ncbi:hypothetical protein [Sorangium sp. So ce426]|uniref:hypothetical protein n=1 Tax=unclassified Sorangium TaxID=2621164 RepID=UPI003F5B87C5
MRGALALVAILLLGCGGAASRPPAGVAAALHPTAVIGWAVGSEHRGEEPPLGYRHLLALPSKPPAGKALGAARPVLPGCFEAMAFLPAPGGDPRFFFLRAGVVHVSRTTGEMPARLAGNDPVLGITRLLAFDRQASPLGLLVAARPDGAQDEQLWLLVIGDGAILSASPFTDERYLSSQEAFFERYSAPRCLDGGRKCLVPSWDGTASFLDVEPVRGKSPVVFQDFSGVPIADAAWAPDGQTYYVLVPCPVKGD